MKYPKLRTFISSSLLASVLITSVTACNSGVTTISSVPTLSNISDQTSQNQFKITANYDKKLNYWLIGDKFKLTNINDQVYLASLDKEDPFYNIMFPIEGVDNNGNLIYNKVDLDINNFFPNLLASINKTDADIFLDSLNSDAKRFAQQNPEYTKYCIYSQNSCYFELIKNDKLFHTFAQRFYQQTDANDTKFRKGKYNLQSSAGLWSEEVANPRLWFLNAFLMLAKKETFTSKKFRQFDKEDKPLATFNSLTSELYQNAVSTFHSEVVSTSSEDQAYLQRELNFAEKAKDYYPTDIYLSCGPSAANSFIFANNGTVILGGTAVIATLKWLTNQTENTLKEIESFTMTFKGYRDFIFPDIYSTRNTHANKFYADFAMSPEHLISYLSNTAPGLKPKQQKVDIEFNSHIPYRNAILGLATIEKETAGNPYEGLEHWVFIDTNGYIYSSGKAYLINDYLSKHPEYRKVRYVLSI